MEDLMNWASPVPLFGVEDPDRLERMRSFLENYAEAHRLKQTSVSLRFAWKCHEGQFRKSRNRLPYISHPLLMAIHAVTLGLVDDDLLAACLLHDVLEDCPVSREELPCS
jgi:GTP pyrophosphokinase